MKTNIMVCVGSTLFAATALVVGSLTTGVDPTRMIGQIITGIGFLGAGSIFKDQEKIRGLTSAALIWILGAIGILIALGGYVLSIIMALGLVCLIITVQTIEKKWFNVDEES
jgi:putative Mg2+ transporter-C (MgtC) family protein